MVVSQLPPPIHGSTVMTKTFMDSLASLGLDQVLLVQRDFSRNQEEVETFSSKKLLKAPAFLRRILSAARHEPGVCVYFAAVTPLALIGDIIALEIVKRRGVPVVLYLHGMGYAELAHRGAMWRQAVSRLFSGADRVVILTDYQRSDVPPFIKAGQLFVVSNTAGPELSAPERKPKRATFLFLSNLLPEKGIDVFLRAAALVAPEVDPVFVVAGAAQDNAYLATLKEQAVATGIGDRVEFVGRVDQVEKERLLSSATALVFPSRYPLETFGLVVLEAKRHGVPTIVSSHASLPFVVRDGIDGFVVSPNDAVGFASHMSELARDGQRGVEMGRSARSDYRERFSEDAFNAAWCGILSKYIPISGETFHGTGRTTGQK